jgi:hypothetical protein
MNISVRIFFTLSLSLLIFRSFSQTFNAGLSAGLTVSEINGANTDQNRRGFHKLGVTAGGVANFRIAKKTLFQFEINFTQKGSMQPPDSLNNGYYKIALGYVEIPVLLRQQIFFNWKGKKINKVDLEFGASYGKMIQRTVIGNTNYQLNNTEKYYNSDDISLLAGIDYNFTNNICFNFRYSNSLIPAVKRSTLVNGLISQTFNRGNNMVFQFGFKFLFTAMKKASTPNETVTPAPIE